MLHPSDAEYRVIGNRERGTGNGVWSIFDFINPGLLGSLKVFQAATVKSNDFSVVRKLTRPFILRRPQPHGGEKLVTEMSDAELMDLVRLDASAVEK